MSTEPAYVAPMAPPALRTAEELLHLRLPDKRVELVRGVQGIEWLSEAKQCVSRI